jgi:NADH-quinone oxidoreductase subunit H
MKFGWKVLIPASLAWIVLVATFRALRNNVEVDLVRLSVVAVGVVLLIFVASYALESARERRRERAEEQLHDEEREWADRAHPVPPMPGETFEYTPRARQTVPSAVAAGDAADDAEEAPRA